MPYAVAIAMTKLGNPWQIVRVAALAAESHQVAKIATTPFSVVVDLLVADVERFLLRAEAARNAQETERLAARPGTSPAMSAPSSPTSKWRRTSPSPGASA